MQRSRIVMSVFLVLALCCFVPSQAQNATAPVVAIAFNDAVLRTTESQQALSALQTKFASRQRHLQTMSTEIEALKKQVTEGSGTLSEADRNTRMKTLDQQEKQFQREAEDFKSDTDSAVQQAFQATAQKLYAFLGEYAKQQGYGLVIDRGSETAPVVWYAASQMDITDRLVQAYNQKTPATPEKGSLLPAPAPTHP